MTSYFAAPAERRDVIRPETDNPLTVSALGTSITGVGFSNPYRRERRHHAAARDHRRRLRLVQPRADPLHAVAARRHRAARRRSRPARCRPRPRSAARAATARTRRSTTPTACSWRSRGTSRRRICDAIPAASGDVSGYKSLPMGAAVNFFDPRNPSRGTDAIWNPGLDDPGLHDRADDRRATTASVAAGEPALRHRAAPDHRHHRRPRAHRAQPDPRPAQRTSRPRASTSPTSASSSSASAAPASRRPARSSSPTSASRRP